MFVKGFWQMLCFFLFIYLLTAAQPTISHNSCFLRSMLTHDCSLRSHRSAFRRAAEQQESTWRSNPNACALCVNACGVWSALFLSFSTEHKRIALADHHRDSTCHCIIRFVCPAGLFSWPFLAPVSWCIRGQVTHAGTHTHIHTDACTHKRLKSNRK